jgi:V/A-type H+-transporting ATPase subunit K
MDMAQAVSELLRQYFVQTGLGWAVTGAILAAMFGCIGSARGIRVAAGQAAGVLAEKPDLFGKMLVLIALPGTQGFYGFIGAIFISLRIGLLSGNVAVPPVVGLALLAIGVGQGIVEWRSAVFQGETSAACINMVARRPEESGRAIILPAMVETYAVVALLTAILLILWVTGSLTVTNPLAA